MYKAYSVPGVIVAASDAGEMQWLSIISFSNQASTLIETHCGLPMVLGGVSEDTSRHNECDDSQPK